MGFEGRATARVRGLRRRIERWRRTRQKLWPMPAGLWDEAVALARTRGVYAVARRLGLNYESLKQRVGKRATNQAVGPQPTGGFVELSGAQLFGAPVGPVVEISDADTRLTVRLAGGSALDVVALVDAFRRRA